jgi:hypothetical protein
MVLNLVKKLNCYWFWKFLKLECKLNSDKSEIEPKGYLMGFITNEIFYHRKFKYDKYDY